MTKATTNKVIFHICGGTGANVINQIGDTLQQLGDGYADVEFNFLDTTASTVTGVALATEDNTHYLLGKNIAGPKVDGSAGIRKLNASVIEAGVSGYVDKMDLRTIKTGVYHCVISSASGGTGSTVATYLCLQLVKAGQPFFMTLVGDSRVLQHARITSNTLASIDRIASINNTAIGAIYVNNSTYTKASKGAYNAINEILLNTLGTMLLLLSGTNHDLDNADMKAFLDPTIYNKAQEFQVPAGMYGISLFTGTAPILEDNMHMIVARSLTVPGMDINVDYEVSQHKTGIVVDDNALTRSSEGLPLHAAMVLNWFSTEIAAINNIVEAATKKVSKISATEIPVNSTTGAASEDGIIL